MQVNQLIRQQFPGTEVVGSNYPPPATNVALSKLVSFGTMGAVATTFFGEKMFEMLGMPRPEFVQSMQSNKMGSCMGAWFLGNTVSQNLLNTGAFEVRTETDRNRSSRGPLYPPTPPLSSPLPLLKRTPGSTLVSRLGVVGCFFSRFSCCCTAALKKRDSMSTSSSLGGGVLRRGSYLFEVGAEAPAQRLRDHERLGERYEAIFVSGQPRR